MLIAKYSENKKSNEETEENNIALNLNTQGVPLLTPCAHITRA